jgi:lipopolysaccharide exporter
MTPILQVDPNSIRPKLVDALRARWAGIRSGQSIKAKVFKGGVWLGSGLLAEQAVRFGRNMLLTRLLAPEAFGVMAVVTSAISILHTMMDIGVREALIQNPRGTEKEYVGAAWWMSFVRAVSFWTLLSLFAPLVARFYGNPELVPLLRVCAVGLIFDGALSAKAHVAVKEMKFRRWAIINHGGGISGVLTTVALSFFIRDVWALVLGYCAESLFRCILSYIVCPYLPPLKCDRAALKDLFTFSRRMFGLSLLNLIFARTDIFVLAKLHSTAELGLYSMAIYLVQTPASFVMNLLGQTILPALSRVQDDKARMSNILLQTTSIVALVGTPALVFALFCGRSLLSLAYGPKYAAAAGPLIVASAVALVNLLNGQITSVFFASGHPHLHRRSIAIMAATMVILIYPSVREFGLVGGQLSCLAALLTGFLFQIARAHSLIGLSVARYSRAFLNAIMISISGVTVCLGTWLLASNMRPIFNLSIGLLSCVLAYGLTAMILVKDKRRLLA